MRTLAVHLRFRWRRRPTGAARRELADRVTDQMLLIPALLFLSPGLPQDPFVAADDFLFARSLAAPGDVDGDGWTDFAAGCDGASSEMDGVVELVSGRRGERIWIANAAGLRKALGRR